MPSTSTFYAGVLRPPTISVLADRCAPNSAARPARPVVIFTGFSISIPAAGSRACSVAPTRHSPSASSGTLPLAAMPTLRLR